MLGNAVGSSPLLAGEGRDRLAPEVVDLGQPGVVDVGQRPPTVHRQVVGLELPEPRLDRGQVTERGVSSVDLLASRE